MSTNSGKVTVSTTPDHVYYIIGIYTTVAFIVSVCCNVFVGFIFCRIFKRKRFTVNLIIINICVANALQACPPSLFVVVNSFEEKYVFGHSVCLFDSVWVTLCAVTVITLLGYLGYERYHMIKSMRTGETRVSLKNVLSICGCWLYALFWSVMPLLGWSSYGIEGLRISCSVDWYHRTASAVSYVGCLFMAAYVVPINVICFTYYKTWRVIRQARMSIKPDKEVPGTKSKASGKDAKVAVMGALMAGSFFITWTPYAIVSFISFINPSLVTPLQSTIPCIIAKTSAIYYPLICAAKHNEFKAEYKKFLCGNRSSVERVQTEVTSTHR